MIRHIFGAVLLAAMTALASPRLSAQDETQFFKKPTNAAEYWRAITFEMNVGKFEFAAELLKGLLESNPNDKELLDLEAKYTMVPFLKLRNVERWTEKDPKLDPQAKKREAETRKNVEDLIERISAALKKELADPARITRFAKNLVATPEEIAFAQKEIRRSGAAAIPVLAGVLKNNKDPELREAIIDLLPKLDSVTVPPIVALLDVDEPTLKLELLDALRRRADYLSLPARIETNIIPALWFIAAPGTKVPEELRKQARSMLGGLLQVDAERRISEIELTNLAEQLYQHKGVFSNPTEVQIWRWDGEALNMSPASISAAEEYFGLRYARWALALKSSFLPAQIVFASLATDKAMLRSGIDRPLSKGNPVLYDLLVSAPYEMLAATLERALSDNKSTVALALVQVLGDRAEREAGRQTARDDGGATKTVRPALLVRALNYSDRRVQIAAAEALLRIPGPPTHGAAPRIVEVLRDALSDDPPAVDAPSRPKALLGDPERFRAESFAVLLRQLGFDVEMVRTGKDLIRRVQQRPDVDLLLVDHRIPGPMLPDFLAQSRADSRAGALPLIVIASSERSSAPQLLTALARLAVLITVEARDDIDRFIERASEEVYRQRVDIVLRERQAKLQQFAEAAGLQPSRELTNRVEYLTLVANSAIFDKADIAPRIIALKPFIKPDEVEPAVNKERIERILKVATQKEAGLPVDRLAQLEKVWVATLQTLPPWPGARDELLENRLRFLTKYYKNTKVIPDVFTDVALRDELISLLADPKTAPLTDAEKRANGAAAIEWLRKMAVGELTGFDVRPAERSIRVALENDDTASPAIEAAGRMPTKECQQALANVALAGNRPAPLRIKAADTLIKHLQMHGKVLGEIQVKLIQEQAAKEANPDLQARFQALEGILSPNSQQTGTRLQLYNPSLGEAPAPMPEVKEEPKKEEPKKEEPKKEEPKEKEPKTP